MRLVVDTMNNNVVLPELGEVWLCIETGMLYEMLERVPSSEDRWYAYRKARRLHASKDYGRDPTVIIAVHDACVREGRFVRVLNAKPAGE